MNIATLTRLQRETLLDISCGKVTMRNTGTASFRIFGGAPTVVGRLIAMKLARWPKGHVGEQVCELTPEGLATVKMEPAHDHR